jgi:hypothetical protein
MFRTLKPGGANHESEAIREAQPSKLDQLLRLLRPLSLPSVARNGSAWAESAMLLQG